MWQVDDMPLIQFSCHIALAFNAETMLAEQLETLQAARWNAVRPFKESEGVARQLSVRERADNDNVGAACFAEQPDREQRYRMRSGRMS
jgi:hypothetical protein